MWGIGMRGTMSQEAILDYFQRVRARTLDFLADLPEEILERPPAAGPSVADSLRHIAQGADYWCHHVFLDGVGETKLTRENCSGREALRAALETSAERLRAVFTAGGGAALERDFPVPWDKSKTYNGTERLLYLAAHEAHHRGRAVQAARELGWAGKVRFPY
jgi:uncharacterized damage-inducible protein DinB